MQVPWAWFRKIAGVLFGVALLAGLGASALFMGQRMSLETWRIIFVLALIVLIITSTILVPGVLLPTIRDPHPEFLSEDLADEWRELRERSFSRSHLLVAGGVVAALVYLWLIFYYGKVTNAIWFGWLPVGVAAIGLSLLLYAFARRTPWFYARTYRTPGWVALVAFAGFFAALALGIFMTEQPASHSRQQRLNAVAQETDYAYVGTRAYYITRDFVGQGIGVPDVEVPDCDGEECGAVILAILFIVLVLVLVLGATFIPHMWVLSGLVLLTLIALIALHELRRDRSLETWHEGERRRTGPIY
jgi:drug/metabolite transporter (DMT)-like permease